MLINEARLQKVSYSSQLADGLQFKRTARDLERLPRRLSSYKELSERGLLPESNPVHTAWIESDLEDAMESYNSEKEDDGTKRRFDVSSWSQAKKTILMATGVTFSAFFICLNFDLNASASAPIVFSSIAFSVGMIVSTINRAKSENFDKFVATLGRSIADLWNDILGPDKTKEYLGQ
jgi:hypothetical protein